ncbi:MAG: 4-hydroxythreonine-4-phosphate dehydrogenase [Devosia sp.]
MDFIFMLTRGDKTVEDALNVLDLIKPLGLTHIGFKDVGVPPATLHELTERVRAMGATSYMEVVSETPEAVLNSARVAREVGIDRLLGGTDVARVKDILGDSPTQYYPFPGFPKGHPTKLGGKADDVESHCRAFRASGCAGADLLAYRATEADPLELVRAARSGLGADGYLIVAGSIASKERIRAVAEAGGDAFTIGTAVFDGSYNPRKGSLLSQLSDVIADCQSV